MIVAVSGTPYAGKSKLLSKFIRDPAHYDFFLHQRITTRKKRDREDDAPPYVFVTDSEFDERLHQEEFLIVEHNFGSRYGILIPDIAEAIRAKRRSIIQTNVERGFDIVRTLFPEALLIFVTPVAIREGYRIDLDDLRRTLLHRITDRECQCSFEDLLAYCEREIRALERFPGCEIILNPDGDDSFARAYSEFKNLIEGFQPEASANHSPCQLATVTA